METPTTVATWLSQERSSLARRLTAQLFARDPRWRRFGERGLQRCTEDTAFLLDHLTEG